MGVADFKITDDLLIEILYTDRQGERPYPGRYFISRIKAKQYPTQLIPAGVLLRIIPIADLELREG